MLRPPARTSAVQRLADQGAGRPIDCPPTSQRNALKPVIDTMPAIVADFRAAGDDRPMDRVTFGLVLLAIGDSLVGAEVAEGTGQARPRSENSDNRSAVAISRSASRTAAVRLNCAT